MTENKELTLTEKVDLITDAIANNPKLVKQVKLNGKGKVSKSKIKKGWVGILKVGENRNISLEKVKIEDSVFKIKEGTYHASDGREILWWQGKFPIVIQSDTKLNPVDFFKEYIHGENQTYGQKYVMATMLKDSIKEKKKGGGGLIWIIVIAAIAFGGLKLFKII